jgi:endogenous inhibitor of DNA gyrase (YacG/DUF329 family)
MSGRPRHVCPTCGREAAPPGASTAARDTAPAAPAGNTSFPFCSPACKLVDLGRWFDGDYRIPGPAVRESSEDDE